MRSVLFRFEDFASLSAALAEARGALSVPEGETIVDGEWVLAIFEIGSRRRATAAAARAVRAAGDPHLAFERRDWDRLVAFVAARSERARACRSIEPGAPTLPPAGPPTSTDAPPRSRRLDDLPPSSALESTRIPFGARVLVVDEDDGSGHELRETLREMGLVVELAADTECAGDRMCAERFDAIVIDLHAPGSDSRAFVSQLRCGARGADIPVLFLSAEPTSRDLVDAFASGGDDFLPKPFRTPELAARIFGLLRRARLARAAGEPGR